MPYIVDPIIFTIVPDGRLRGGPMLDVLLNENSAGGAQPQANWDEALWEWELKFTAETGDFGTAHGFWLGRRGMQYGWFFEDPLCHTSTQRSGTGKVLLADDSKYYLYVEYPDLIRPYRRRIRRVKSDSWTLGGGAASGTVNEATGEVTGESIAAGTATFEFYCPVAFMSRKFEAEFDAATGEWSGVVVRELLDYTVNEIED